MNKEVLLQALACFGCEYKDDCENIGFAHGKEWCEGKYKDAIHLVDKMGFMSTKDE